MDIFEVLSAVFKQLPEDACEEQNRGKEYIIKCPYPDCNGHVHVVHSLYNGHMHAKCDKCKFVMME